MGRKSHPAPPYQQQSLLSSFLPEILSLLLTIVSLAALVVLLITQDKKPIYTLRGGITLNTIVAVLSTISKASLLLVIGEGIGQWKWILFAARGSGDGRGRLLRDFDRVDKASQGPLGSLKLLVGLGMGKV